ncbi:MAG: hypothetical protein IT502_01865 [Rubrivivax sp.]|nr:hypothetical protein [Rubrivivax sp.]
MSRFVALTTLALGLCAGAALAKLPPLSDEAKAKAAEAAAKAAWAGKVEAYRLCKVQDTVAAEYLAHARKEGRKTDAPTATPPCADPGPFVAAPAPAAAPAVAAAPAPAAGKKK